MDIRKEVTDGILILALVGDFDTTETDWFSAEISEAIDGGHFRVLLDLGGLEFINSTALGTLLRAQKRLAQYGGGLAATGASSDVAKTFRILQLDRKIPLFPTADAATDHLKSLSPEGVSASGEEVEFRVAGAEDVLGPRPRRARLESLHEEGLVFAFENLEGIDSEAAFPNGAAVELRFRLPLYHQSHVFRAEGSLVRHEPLGRETVLLHVVFRDLSETDREAVRQYVKDLRFLKGDD